MSNPLADTLQPPGDQSKQTEHTLSPVSQLLMDQQQRWHTGDRVFVESYLEQQPQLRADAQGLLCLVRNEILIRRQQGDGPPLEEYARRFPELKAQFEGDFVRDSQDTDHSVIPQTLVAESGTPGPSASSPTLAPPKPISATPQTISDYELQGVLGRGGMGVVYKARQKRLNRIVALKMMLGGVYASDDEIRRFHLEAEAAAKLQHPNIAQIYEHSEIDGKPYFSLEYVEGGSLAQKLDGTPQDPAASAQLIETLAKAMHYAHQRGIVHRDLKPANILLGINPGNLPGTAFGVPKVTDFGLAKRMDVDLRQTHTGAILGTPSYMAPEQAGGRIREIGPATDIYALGAILYDMLTGRPPFKANTLADTLQQVQMSEPVPPVRLQPNTPKDLETICLKALHKEPARRYATALDFAQDLGRFLAGEPIQARPTPTWERVWKWSRRNPYKAGMIGVAAASLVAIITLQSISNVRLSIAHRKEREQRELAERNFELAEANFSRALLAIDGFLVQVASVDLGEIPQMAARRRQMLAKAAELFRDLPTEKSDDPRARYLSARQKGRQAEFNALLNRSRDAENSYLEAISDLQLLHDEFPNDKGYRQELARNVNNLGVLYKDMQVFTEASRQLERAQKLRKDLADSDRTPDALNELAETNYNRGMVLQRLPGKQAEAERVLLEALALREELLAWNADKEGSEDRKAGYEKAKAMTQNELGRVAYRLNRIPDAERIFTETIGTQEQLIQEHPEPSHKRLLARTRNNLALVLWKTAQRRTSAESLFTQVLKDLRQLTLDHPEAPAYQDDLGKVNRAYAALLVESKRLDEAEKSCRKALEIHLDIVKRFSQFPEYRLGLADDYLLLGIIVQPRSSAEAAREFAAALPIMEGLIKDHPGVPYYHSSYAHVLNSVASPKVNRSIANRALLENTACVPDLVLCNLGALAREHVLRHWLAATWKDGLTEALPLLRHAVVQLQLAQAANPRNPEYPEFLGRHQKDLITVQKWLDDYEGAAKSVKQLVDWFPDDSERHRIAAEFYSAFVDMAQRDPRITSEQRIAFAQEYAAHAVRCLRRAFELGYKDSGYLKDPTFKPVADREDFKELLREVEQTKTERITT